MLVIDFSLPKEEILARLQQAEDWQLPLISFVQEWLDESVESFPIHTSGSTGTPKTIQHSRQQLTASAERTNAFFEINEHSSLLLCLPVNHIGGRMMVVRAALAKAELFCVQPSANPLHAFRYAGGITLAAFTPMQCFDILKEATTREIFHQLQNSIIGGGQLSTELIQSLCSSPTAIYETFGMTETISHIALRQVAPVKQDYFQCLEGVTISTDKDSQLLIKIEGQPELHTNDIVELINEKQFRWLGRADDVINTGGLKFFTNEIENKLRPYLSFPFFITSLPDAKYGQQIALVVESEVDEVSLQSIFTQHLAPFEKPKSILRVAQFEYSDLGKLLKKKTMERLGK